MLKLSELENAIENVDPAIPKIKESYRDLKTRTCFCFVGNMVSKTLSKQKDQTSVDGISVDEIEDWVIQQGLTDKIQPSTWSVLVDKAPMECRSILVSDVATCLFDYMVILNDETEMSIEEIRNLMRSVVALLQSEQEKE